MAGGQPGSTINKFADQSQARLLFLLLFTGSKMNYLRWKNAGIIVLKHCAHANIHTNYIVLKPSAAMFPLEQQEYWLARTALSGPQHGRAETTNVSISERSTRLDDTR